MDFIWFYGVLKLFVGWTQTKAGTADSSTHASEWWIPLSRWRIHAHLHEYTCIHICILCLQLQLMGTCTDTAIRSCDGMGAYAKKCYYVSRCMSALVCADGNYSKIDHTLVFVLDAPAWLICRSTMYHIPLAGRPWHEVSFETLVKA